MEETEEKFLIRVNGFAIRTAHEQLVAREILELAKKQEAFSGKPEDYLLMGDKGLYGSKDQVNVREDDLFVAISDRPTLVA